MSKQKSNEKSTEQDEKIIKQLEKMGACESAIDWVRLQNSDNIISLINKAMKEEYFDWVNWYLLKRMNKGQQISFAVFAAEQVLETYEKEYPDDTEPRETINVARKYWKNKKIKDKDIISEKYVAASLANVVTYSETCVASSMAYAAAYVAIAAYTAINQTSAITAAHVAFYMATVVGVELQKKIIKYGIKLTKKGE